MSTSPDDVVILRNPSDIRALVHPARLAVVTALYDRNCQLTATQAAKIGGVSPSAMSYHLRALERAGIAKRAEPTGDGRERPWVRAGTDLTVNLQGDHSYAAVAATEALLEVAMQQDRARLLEAMSRRTDPQTALPLDEGATYRRDAILATAEEARELAIAIIDLFARFDPSTRTNAPKDAGVYGVSLAFIPEADTP